MVAPNAEASKRARVAFAALFTVVLGGCGSNHAELPPELLDAIKGLNKPSDGGPGAASYPPPPYGTMVGATIQDLCFDGWKDPRVDDYDPAKTTRICLSDFHADPQARLLLVESCAVWCVACKFEYQGSGNRPSLAAQLAMRQSRGFRVFGTIFQNGQSSKASAEDASAWASTYDLEFPFAVDADHQMGLFTSPNVAPFNMLIDTRKMQIVLALDGDEPAVLFGKADSFLAAAAQ